MPVISIINRKGGSGKSTVATHVAAWLSHAGHAVMLGDVDRQQSSVRWLRRRQAQCVGGEPIVGWALDPQYVMRPPKGVSHAVLDTPGGLHGFELNRLLGQADLVIVPVCDAFFDRDSAGDCVAELLHHPRVASGRVKLGVVGVRVDLTPESESRMRAWAAEQGVPYLGSLPTDPNYERSAELGLTLFDRPDADSVGMLVHWQPVLNWLQQALVEVEAVKLLAVVRASRPVIDTHALRSSLQPRDSTPVQANVPTAPPPRASSRPRAEPAKPGQGFCGLLRRLLPDLLQSHAVPPRSGMH